MRDYKNVKVPKKYRTASTRVSVKRVSVGRVPGRHSTNFTGRLIQFLTAALVISGCYLGWMGYQWSAHSDAFMISSVDVKGVRQLTEDSIRDIAGAFTGQNVFRVDIDAAARRARANPWVKDVRIHRRLPNRISMVITERAPAAVLDNGKSRYLVDEEGTVMEKILRENAAGLQLPLVQIKDCIARPGDVVSTGGMHEALALISELSSRGGWRISEVTIKADTPESITVLYADHEFKIGSGRFSEKLRRLSEIMADAKQRGLAIAYVDLRPERQAAVMAKNNRIQGGNSK